MVAGYTQQAEHHKSLTQYSRIKQIFAHPVWSIQHGTALAFIWSHFSDHLANVSPIFILLSVVLVCTNY